MKRIDTLFDADARRLAAEDRRIKAVISRSVPANWQSSLLFARVDREVLHLTVQSAASVTNLRFLESAIRRDLSAAGTACRSIRWHVSVQATEPAKREPARRTTKPLSAKTSAHLHAVADSLDDPDLSAALRRLAKAGVEQNEAIGLVPGDDPGRED